MFPVINPISVYVVGPYIGLIKLSLHCKSIWCVCLHETVTVDQRNQTHKESITAIVIAFKSCWVIWNRKTDLNTHSSILISRILSQLIN